MSGEIGRDEYGHDENGRGENGLEPNDFGFRQWEEEDEGWDEPAPPPPGRKRKRLLIAGGLVTGFVVVAYAAATILSGGPGKSAAHAAAIITTPPKTGFSPTSTDPATDAQQTAQAFLTAWQSGNDSAAAALTDSPAAAKTALDAYKTDLDLSTLIIQVQNANADGTVSFSIAATVSIPAQAATSGQAASPAASGVWSYTSQLVAESTSTGWEVQWAPDLLAANLTADTHLMLVPVAPGAGEVTDAKANDLSTAADPGLRKIAGILAASAPVGQGTPGINIVIADASNTPVPGIAPATVTAPVATGAVATTIDPTAEAAAMAAVGMNPQSSMVVIQPSTGDILAIANNDQDNDDALTAQIAPGSTMKVVTSTALLNQGLTPDSPVGCPETFSGTGFPFGNSDNESRPADNPFIDDFAASCNNAFTSQYQQLQGGVLANTAQTYFGLNQPWNIGLGDPQKYFTMPSDASGTELAAEAFGQGTLTANPLAMASVAATVDTGSFHQPILVPGTTQLQATPLPHGTDSDLWSMMRAVVTYSDGTAHGVGFGSGVYAKTGTADHGAATSTPNSWMIVFDPNKDIAIGCVVLGGDFGAQSAGPETKYVLNAM